MAGIKTGHQPEKKAKRPVGRPLKRDAHKYDERDRRAFAPKLPCIVDQVDEFLRGEDLNRERDFSDWSKIKWKMFAEAYYQGGAAGEAYKLAGYKVTTEASAYAGGSRLLSHPWVQAYLRQLHIQEVEGDEEKDQELEKKNVQMLSASDDEIIMFLTLAMRDFNVPMNKRLEAARELAKLRGMYTEKIEVSTPQENEAKILDALGLSEDKEV